MRFAGVLLIFAGIGASISVQAAEGHSKQYVQCMNSAAGVVQKSEKCIQKELKYHTKRMKKAYSRYVTTTNTQDIAKSQHQQWTSLLNQQCQHKTASTYNKLQQGQCRLTMTIVQANRYEAKNITSRKS